MVKKGSRDLLEMLQTKETIVATSGLTDVVIEKMERVLDEEFYIGSNAFTSRLFACLDADGSGDIGQAEIDKFVSGLGEMNESDIAGYITR